MKVANLTQPPMREEFFRNPSSAYCTIEVGCTEEEFAKIGDSPRFSIKSTSKGEYLKHGGWSKVDGGWNANRYFHELGARRDGDTLYITLPAPYMNCLSSNYSYVLEIEGVGGELLRTSFVVKSLWHTQMADDPVLIRPVDSVTVSDPSSNEPDNGTADKPIDDAEGTVDLEEVEISNEDLLDSLDAGIPPEGEQNDSDVVVNPEKEKGKGRIAGRVVAAVLLLILLATALFYMFGRGAGETVLSDSDRVEAFFSPSSSRSAQGAMELYRSLKKKSAEDNEAAFRLLFFAADLKDYPEAWLPYAEFLDPQKPSGIPQLKNSEEAAKYYKKAGR